MFAGSPGNECRIETLPSWKNIMRNPCSSVSKLSGLSGFLAERSVNCDLVIVHYTARQGRCPDNSCKAWLTIFFRGYHVSTVSRKIRDPVTILWKTQTGIHWNTLGSCKTGMEKDPADWRIRRIKRCRNQVVAYSVCRKREGMESGNWKWCWLRRMRRKKN